MTPSKYQEEIYAWVDKSGNASVSAVAGSGKTTTLVQMAPLLNGGATFCAFNKHIADELAQKLPSNVRTRTIHSIGYSAISHALRNRKLDVNGKKYRELTKDAGKNWKNWNAANPFSAFDAAKLINSIVQMSINTRTDLEDVAAVKTMCTLYDISVHPRFELTELCVLAKDVLKAGMKMVEEQGIIDYPDMLHYPLTKDFSFWQNDWLLVDEAQDLSAAQLAVVRRALKWNGRLIAVGDPMQSIYGFSGADPWSFSRIGKEFDTTELPLSVCYRCPKEIIRLAQKLVPAIEWADFAEDGIVKQAKNAQEAQPGDLIVCRTNAPLFAEYAKFLKAGRPAYIVGQRDALSSILTLIDRVEKVKGYTGWPAFPAFLAGYEKELIAQLKQAGEDPSRIMRERDRCDVVRNCLEIFPDCRSTNDFKGELERIFRPSPESVRLSSIHRAKGLETDNLFLLCPERVRLWWPTQQPWQAYQEQCCEYVMLTRAKKSLNFIGPYKIGKKIKLQEQHDKKKEETIYRIAATAVDSVGDESFFD